VQALTKAAADTVTSPCKQFKWVVQCTTTKSQKVKKSYRESACKRVVFAETPSIEKSVRRISGDYPMQANQEFNRFCLHLFGAKL